MYQNCIEFSDSGGHPNRIRIFAEDSQTIWFAADDLARALSHHNTFGKHLDSLFSTVPSSWRKKQHVEVTEGHSANILCITETGVYFFLGGYKNKKKAQTVQEAISKALPAIRSEIRGAGLELPDTPDVEAILGDPDTFIKTLQAYKEEKALREQAEAKSLELEAKNIKLEETRASLESKIANDAEKVRFAEAVEAHPTSISIGSMAKLLQGAGYNIAEKKLFSLLYRFHYLIKKGKRRRTAYQKWIDRGLFEVTEKLIKMKDGTEKPIITTMVTGKGQHYLLRIIPALLEK